MDGCLDHHLGGKFHAGTLQVKTEDRATLEAAQSTMKVPTGATKKQASNGGQHGVANIAVERWHGPGKMPPLKRLPITS